MNIEINDRTQTVLVSMDCPVAAQRYSVNLPYETYVNWLAGIVPTCSLGLTTEDQFFLDHGISPTGQRAMKQRIQQARSCDEQRTKKKNSKEPRKKARQTRRPRQANTKKASAKRNV